VCPSRGRVRSPELFAHGAGPASALGTFIGWQARPWWRTVAAMTSDAPNGLLIRAEARADWGDIAAVQAMAFGDGDRVPTLVDALRAAKAPLPALSFVACLDDRVVGHVMLSASRVDALPRLVDVYTLSPLGVQPEYQGRGIGTRLIEHALKAADQQRVPLVFLEGSPHFYGRRGFRAAQELGFRAPTLRYPPGAFQVAALSAHQDWMAGTFVYSETFWALDLVGLRDPELTRVSAEIAGGGKSD